MKKNALEGHTPIEVMKIAPIPAFLVYYLFVQDEGDVEHKDS